MNKLAAVLFSAAGVAGLGLLAKSRSPNASVTGLSDAIPATPATPEILPDFIVTQESDIPMVSTSGVRGIRNNNPGNIRKTSDKWKGLSAVQDDPSFFVFTAPEWGVRAIGKILTNYNAKYSLDTVRKLISRWAPGHENPTGSYVTYVAAQMGVEPDQVIDVVSYLPELALAIIRFENGKMPYDPNNVRAWVRLP